MNKLFSFTAGLICGAVVGAVTALLTTPASGAEMTAEAKRRWEEAIAEGKRAQAETIGRLEREYNQLRTKGE